MSAKVSAAASASAGANIGGGKPSAASNAAPAGGNAGADGVAATPGARGSAAPGTNAGPGAGGGGRFSSAMADAAQAGEQTTDAQLGKLNAEGASGHNTAAANPATSASTSTASTPIVSAPEIDADVAQLLNPAAGKQNSSTPVSTATAGSGKPGAKSSTGTRGTGADTATTTPTEPVMLAMLLAASGMQLTGAGGAGGASDAAAGAAGSAGDGQSAISVTRLAARITAGLPASDPGVDAASAATTTATTAATAAASGAGNGAALAAQAAVPDAANSATAAAGTTGGSAGAGGGADVSDKSALSAGRSAITDTAPAQPSIMTDSSGLPELVRSFAGSATQAPSVEASISVPVANGGWPHAVAAQVHWFVSNDIQSATLRLSPEHLGPVEVRIDVHDSQVNVNFSAAHADTRAALEQTVPRLREIFAGSGLTLGQANVQQDPRPGSQSSATPGRPAFTAAQAVEPVAVATPQGLGLVDEYA